MKHAKRLNHLLSLILCILLVLGTMTFALPLSAAAGEDVEFAGGEGTAAQPWLIETPEQLDALRNFLDTTHRDKHFQLKNDIDLTAYLAKGGAGYKKWGTRGWEPIGTEELIFYGNLDGNNFLISGLWINRSSLYYVGLFGFAESGKFENIGILLENTKSGVRGAEYVGGLVGYQENGSVVNSYVLGDVTGADATDGCIGGLVGLQDGGSIMDSYTAGHISGTSNLGGLVGLQDSNSSIVNCYSTGRTSGSISVGGLAGIQGGVIQNSYSTCSVNGYFEVGGLTGYQSETSRIINCYATGNVQGEAGDIGGLVGSQHFGTITNSYATGSVSGTEKVGGLVGGSTQGTSTKSFFDKNTTGQKTGAGSGSQTGITGKTTTEMKVKNTFINAGWNFSDVWGIYEKSGYPYLASFKNDILIQPVSGSKPYDGVAITAAPAWNVVSNGEGNYDPNNYPLSGKLVYESTPKNPGTYKVLLGTLFNPHYQISLASAAYTIAGTAVTGVALDRSSATLNINKTLTLKATVTPSDASNKTVSWKTSNAKVAAVDKNGKVTANAAGMATITVTTEDGKKTAACKLTVKIPVSKVTIGGAPATMFAEGSKTLTANILPSNATNKAVTWSSSDTTVAKVSQSGKVTAVRAGKVTIKATSKDRKEIYDTVMISVHQYVTLKIGSTTAIQNGKKTTIDNAGTKPFKISGKTMIPLRFIGEKMGGNVNYVNDSQPITMSFGDIRVEFKLKDKKMKIITSSSTKTVALDVPAQKVKGKTYIPLRAIGQALGFDIYYQAGTEYIVVSNPTMTPEIKNERLNEAKKVIK